MNGVRIVAALCVLSIVAMLWLFVISSQEMGLSAGLREVAGTWWGITTLADLGVGLLFVALWICLLERKAWARPLWVLAVFMLGNFTTLIYILVRCRRARSIRELILGTP
jgi:hypothetical protein